MLFDVIGVLVQKFEEINLPELKRCRDDSYKKGYREPAFWSTKEPVLQSKRVPDQNKYKYCTKTMGERNVGMTDAAIHQSMFDNYKVILGNYEDF